MNNIISLNGYYYFIRRVPKYLKGYDPRQEVRAALFTDSRREAIRLALIHNEMLEDYWRDLVTNDKQHCLKTYKEIVFKNRLAGFIQDKVETPKDFIPTRPSIAAESTEHRLTIQEGLTRFWLLARNKTVNKSPNQIRKWQTPRRAAIKNFIECVGNKAMQDVTRADILKFRDWWIDRIQKEALTPNAANKNLIQTKVIFETVSDNLSLELDIKTLFRKLLLEENFDTNRLPFETEYLRNTLLNQANLTGLPEQLRCLFYAIAETGAGVAEQLSLLPEDIHLDCEIPYIEITPRHQKALKTRYRKRTITS